MDDSKKAPPRSALAQYNWEVRFPLRTDWQGATLHLIDYPEGRPFRGGILCSVCGRAMVLDQWDNGDFMLICVVCKRAVTWRP